MISTKTIDDHHIIIFYGDEDLVDVHHELKTFPDAILVPMLGTKEELPTDRVLVKNYNASLENSLLWDGIILQEEQEIEIERLVSKYIKNNYKQLVIEEYDFTKVEDFYDYTR